MSFPSSFVEELRNHLSVIDVIGRRLTWDQRKTNAAKGDYWACCPFHGEKTPSFHVDERKGFYYCFGCQAKGDMIGFTMQMDNLSFPEAVETLANFAGLTVPQQGPHAIEKEKKKTGLIEANEAAAAFFRLQFRTARAAEARSYLEQRGLNADTLKQFEIGWAPDSSTALQAHLKEKGFSLDTLIEAGLSAQPENGGNAYDRFRARIIYPIRNPRGQVIGFGGRSLDPNARAKYLNSPETPLFSKGKQLYNYGPARAGDSSLIVAEGYMDVIALAQAGFARTVAPLGTALTAEQMRLLWRAADEPVLALDGDEAGLRAAMRAIDTALPLLQAGKSLRFALLPGGNDPDDIIRSSGPAAMRKIIDDAEPLIEMLWRRETSGQQFDTPERRAALDQRLRAVLNMITDSGLRNHYGQSLKERRYHLFRPAKQNFYAATPYNKSNNRFSPAVSAGAKSSTLAHASMAEETHGMESALLLAVLRRPKLLEKREQSLSELKFHSSELDLIRNALLLAVMENAENDSVLDADNLRAVITEKIGNDPERILLQAPQIKIQSFTDISASDLLVEQRFDEILNRLTTRIIHKYEIAEAEQSLLQQDEAGLENTRLDERIRAAVIPLYQPDTQEEIADDSDFTDRLNNFLKEEIWVKHRK